MKTSLRVMLFLIGWLFLIVTTNAGGGSSGGDFEINRYTIDNGGGASGGGIFSLQGTIGQPEAGVVSSGGSFTLQGGFWASAVIDPTVGEVFSDGFESP